MPELFGIDIAGLVNDSVQSAGGLVDGTLYRDSGNRNPADLTDSTVQTTEYGFSGFVSAKQVRIDGLVKQGMPVITILGASIDTVPMVNDRVLMDGRRYMLTQLIRSDPAEAVFEFQASENG